MIRADMVRLGQFFFRFRNWLFPVVLLLAIAIAEPHFLFGDAGWDHFMDMFGALLSGLGLMIRAITIGFEYIVRGGRNRRVYADNLVTGGVYAQVRNPMYLGNGLIMLGIVLIINSPLFYAVGLPLTVLAYAAIIAAEEDFLRRKFGSQFDDYCRRVPRILPRLSGFGRAIEGMEFNWRRLVVKEYGTIFIISLTVFLATLWDDYRILGEDALPPGEEILLVIVLLVLLYAAAWVLKKTRKLTAERGSSGSAG